MIAKPVLKHDIASVVANFQLYGDFIHAEPFGNGHINDTYLAVLNYGGHAVKYTVQRINHNIFKNPAGVMSNIFSVTGHIREKLLAQGIEYASRRVLTFIPTKDNKQVYQDPQGNFWRMYIFVNRAKTYDVIEKPIHAYKAAKAFGEFQGLLSDFPGETLHETIPNFHNGQTRYQAFLDALQKDVKGRAASVKKEIEFLQSRAAMFDKLPGMIARKEIPIRVTHNDCKINNVLLDMETDDGICVIDLDTIMPGLVLYDFGDMIRTSTNTGAEDETDLSKINMSFENFKQVARGYIEAAGGFLTPSERENLVFSGKLITLIIGTRFITDYLAGDVYFKIKHPDHNLDRCRTQFKLVESIESQQEAMEKYLASL